MVGSMVMCTFQMAIPHFLVQSHTEFSAMDIFCVLFTFVSVCFANERNEITLSLTHSLLYLCVIFNLYVSLTARYSYSECWSYGCKHIAHIARANALPNSNSHFKSTCESDKNCSGTISSSNSYWYIEKKFPGQL